MHEKINCVHDYLNFPIRVRGKGQGFLNVIQFMMISSTRGSQKDIKPNLLDQMRNYPSIKERILALENDQAVEESEVNHRKLIFTICPFEVNSSRKILEMIPKGFLRLHTLLHREAIITD